MKITDLTTHDDIRAVLGVSKSELRDATLLLAVYRNNLKLDLDQVDGGLLAAFLTLNPDESQRTAAEVTFASLVQLFATYSVARQLTVSLPLFSPKEISDGKSHLTRYAVDPYKATVQGVLDAFESYKSQLAEAFKGLSASSVVSVVRTYISTAPAATDPVTGT